MGFYFLIMFLHIFKSLSKGILHAVSAVNTCWEQVSSLRDFFFLWEISGKIDECFGIHWSFPGKALKSSRTPLMRIQKNAVTETAGGLYVLRCVCVGAFDLFPYRFQHSTDECLWVASRAKADPCEPLMGLVGESFCCFLEMLASRWVPSCFHVF